MVYCCLALHPFNTPSSFLYFSKSVKGYDSKYYFCIFEYILFI